MQIYLKEKIGRPELFTGRNREISDLLNWVHRIEKEISQSTAILSRRKTGKTALLQRFFNIVFNENKNIIPFYYEIRETDQWLMDFSIEFFLTFVYQFLAFKTRNPEYLNLIQFNSLENALKNTANNGFDYLAALIQSVREMSEKNEANRVWEIVRDAPRFVAGHYNEYIVQIIDEFQFINRYIFRDRNCKDCIKNLAGSYLHTAEYKNAPLLVSGSWIGWLMDDLRSMLPGRFKVKPLEKMSKNEIVEMIYKYSLIEGIPVKEETAFVMADLCEGNPFYISALFRSEFREKDFTCMDGLLKTLEFETTSKWGSIKGTWMEYVNSAFSKINDRNAKKIVLYICQNKDREITRKEIHEKLNLKISHVELEMRMNALVKSDIINQGASNFDYQAVQDNIFDKVFRSVYQKEITAFDPKEIANEYKALYRKILGEYNKYCLDRGQKVAEMS